LPDNAEKLMRGDFMSVSVLKTLHDNKFKNGLHALGHSNTPIAVAQSTSKLRLGKLRFNDKYALE